MLIDTRNKKELIDILQKVLHCKANEAVEKKGSFTIGISGGSLVQILSAAITQIGCDRSKWTVFFCDERVVPTESQDSTFGSYIRKLRGYLDDDQFVQMKQGVDVTEAAQDYELKLKKHFGSDSLPTFDVLMLGIGPDGHTCSLFPCHRLLRETKRWVAPIWDAPKPPAERITFTLPLINNADCIIFAMSGRPKANIVQRVMKDKEDLPATRVKPTKGEVYWILDDEALKVTT